MRIGREFAARLDLFAKAGEQPGVDAVGFGEQSLGLGEVADASGLGDADFDAGF